MVEKLWEVCKVTPAPGSSTDDICLPLTFLDLLNSIFPPVEHLLFYELPPNFDHNTLLSKLKHSLSLTLQHFLPAAGYLQFSPNPLIRYENGDGVILTVSHSDGDFYHQSRQKIRECKKLEPLIAEIVKTGEKVPLIAFKITIFPKQGICIGVTINHSLFDGTSTMMFLDSWAFFSKLNNNDKVLSESLTPVFDRKSVRERYFGLENMFRSIMKKQELESGELWSFHGPTRSIDLVKGTFVLTGSEVNRLKAIAKEKLWRKNRVCYISTFAVIFSYVTVCLAKTKPPKNNRVLLTFQFNCRGRLEPPLPRNYFGNCVGPCGKYFDMEELIGFDGLATLVNFISTTTNDLDNGGALREAQNWLPDIFEADADTETLKVDFVGSINFKFQNLDFGWGKPMKCDVASIDGAGGVTIARQDENHGAIEVELSLSEGEMKTFAHIFDHSLSEMKTIQASL